MSLPTSSLSAIVVCGAAGAGKSTLAEALGARLGRPVLDADALHLPEVRAQMAAGVAMTEAQRTPWLARVAQWIRDRPAGVVACSALRREHRQSLGGSGVLFVQLLVPEDQLRARVQARPEHFMPATLVPSQLAALEPLAAGERGITVVASGTVTQTLEEVLLALGTAGWSGS